MKKLLVVTAVLLIGFCLYNSLWSGKLNCEQRKAFTNFVLCQTDSATFIIGREGYRLELPGALIECIFVPVDQNFISWGSQMGQYYTRHTFLVSEQQLIENTVKVPVGYLAAPCHKIVHHASR